MKPSSIVGLALSVGTSLTLVGGASASSFTIADLPAGYMLAAADTTAPADAKSQHEGMCGEGRCGADAFKAMDKDGDGKLTEQEFLDGRKAMHERMHAEGRCGEGSCGGKHSEGKCGEGNCGGKHGEGNCGEGHCGGRRE